MKTLTTHCAGRRVFTLLIALSLTGCIVRTYSVVKERVDQEVSGNQGYLSGSAPADTQQPRKFIRRKTAVVEIELKSPVRFEKLKEPPESLDPASAQLKRNNDLGSIEVDTSSEAPQGIEMPQGLEEPQQKYDTYIVQKDDTLQKISARPEIYGTTKKWKKIFEANSDKLSSPNRIKPGQEIRIPRE